MKKILIAGTHSGAGKTTITLGIMQALKKRGMKVQPFKVGPDYIDPSYHTHVTGVPSRNLDSYMLEDEKLKYLFNKASQNTDIAVTEGVMGLYDGKGIDINDCSSSYVSKLLKMPVILVVDAKAMGASAAAMVLGYKMIDPSVKICGVIANNVRTESHFKLVKEAIEKYCDTEVLGYFPPNEKFKLPSRHLGLVPSGEMDALEEKFNGLGEEIEKYIDIDRLLELSEGEEITATFEEVEALINTFRGKKMAVAYDKAFSFYYPDNLELLETLGVELCYFSPLEDEVLPSSDFIYIGGGFPELFAKGLEANHKIRLALREAGKKGIPIYAECGGLMYMGERLIDSAGTSYEMVGLLPGYSQMTESLKRFGYAQGIAQKNTILSVKGETLKGHEFHHSEFVTDLEPVYKMSKERGPQKIWGGGYSTEHLLASYLHIHFYSNLNALERFLSQKGGK